MEGTKKIYVAGNYIEKQEFHITGGTNYINTPDDKSENDAAFEAFPENMDGELVEKLKPIFYNNETDVKAFLDSIKGMEPNSITDMVNRWVAEKRISDYGNSRKGLLWQILNDAGLYDKTKSNWNSRVN